MLVQDPSKANDVDSIFNQARQHASAEGPPASSGSRSFTGTARRLTGETVSAAPQPPESVTHTITFWTNGFTISDGPLRRFDDPENASFLEYTLGKYCRKLEASLQVGSAFVLTMTTTETLATKATISAQETTPGLSASTAFFTSSMNEKPLRV